MLLLEMKRKKGTLNVIHFVGIGEALDDLKPFDAELFVDAILQGTD